MHATCFSRTGRSPCPEADRVGGLWEKEGREYFVFRFFFRLFCFLFFGCCSAPSGSCCTAAPSTRSNSDASSGDRCHFFPASADDFVQLLALQLTQQFLEFISISRNTHWVTQAWSMRSLVGSLAVILPLSKMSSMSLALGLVFPPRTAWAVVQGLRGDRQE